MKNPALTNQTSNSSPTLLGFVQGHLLFAYFFLAFAWSWSWEVIGLRVLQLSPEMTEIVLLPAAFGPAVSAFLLIAFTEGKAGVLRLLRRFWLWCVPFKWYLIALIGLPILILLCFIAVPGALAVFEPPSPVFAIQYLAGFILILVMGGPLGEEPGWRGFALPRLQQRYGPLVGSLVLGACWGFWHLPAFFLIPGYNGAGSGFAGIASAFVPYVAATTATAVIYTWLSNNTRGSLLLAILFHASFNTAGSTFAAFFPASVSESLMAQVIEEGVFIGIALLLIAVTRGQLSYQRFLGETEAPAPNPE